MDLLKKQIRIKILKEIYAEKDLFDHLCHAVEDEYAELWRYLDDVVKIRKLLSGAVSLFLAEHPNLKDLPENIRINFHSLVEELIMKPDSLLQKTRAKEIKEIEGYGIKEWFREIKSTLNELNDLITTHERAFNSKWSYGLSVFNQIYDEFSEATRDNDLKVQVLVDLIAKDKNKKLLEIGFGTGPLLRRLWNLGYSAIGYESNQEGLSREFANSQFAQGKVILGEKYYQDYPFKTKFDVIFMESGFFLFTILDDKSLSFEAYYGMDYKGILKNLEKFHSDLNENGMLLIGTQKIMRNIQIDSRHFFNMERQQLDHNALRQLFLYEDEKLIFYVKQRKRTLTYQEFLTMAWQVGFKRVFISPYTQWVVLQK